jgi:hypothetical protein
MIPYTVFVGVAPARKVTVTDASLSVEWIDGRAISVPLAWFPRLLHATPEERRNAKLIGGGHGIHREDIDEVICVEGLLAGKPFGESQKSFRESLGSRTARRPGEKSRTLNRRRADSGPWYVPGFDRQGSLLGKEHG